MDLEERIDELYAGSLDAFVAERDGLAKAVAATGDAEGAARVRALRKPVVPAWALNRLAKERPAMVDELVDLGERLRAAQTRALSGGDVGPLREAIEERRRVVAGVARAAEEVLEGAGVRPEPHRDVIVSTLEAAAVDEEAAGLLRSGRLVKPLRPPSAFGEQGLRVLRGGRPAREAPPPTEPAGADRIRDLERGLARARRRERSAAAAVERARRRTGELERKLGEARTALEAAEAERRGAAVEVERLSAELRTLRR